MRTWKKSLCSFTPTLTVGDLGGGTPHNLATTTQPPVTGRQNRRILNRRKDPESPGRSQTCRNSVLPFLHMEPWLEYQFLGSTQSGQWLPVPLALSFDGKVRDHTA